MSYYSDSPLWSHLSSPSYVLNSPVILDSPLMVDTPLVISDYSQSFVLDTPVISNMSPLYSPTSTYVSPSYAGTSTYVSPSYAGTSTYLSPTYVSPMYVDTSPIYSPSYLSSPLVVSPGYTDVIVSPIHDADDYIPGVIDATSPYNTTLDLTYSSPLLGFSDNLSYSYNKPTTDSSIIETVVDHFYFKTLDKWLYREMNSLLDYFTLSSDGKVTLVKSMSQVKDTNSDKLRSSHVDAISKFVSDKILSKKEMHQVLNEFIKHNPGVDWYDLNRNKRRVMRAIKTFLRKKLERMVSK